MDEQTVKQTVAAIDNFQREFAIIQTYPDHKSPYQLIRMVEQILPHLANIRKTSRKNQIWKFRTYVLELRGERIVQADIKPTQETTFRWIKRCDQIGRQYYRKNAGRIESLREFQTQNSF